MKNPILLFLILCLGSWILACKPSVKVETEVASDTETTEMAYDSVLAKKLGADDYGMRRYVMAFLKTGPTPEPDSAKAAILQRAHLDNIFRLADEGKLAVAGPFLDGGDLRGVYVFNVETVEEAKALTETDPAVQSGTFIMELHPWYGSAATMMVNEWHKKVQKEKI